MTGKTWTAPWEATDRMLVAGLEQGGWGAAESYADMRDAHLAEHPERAASIQGVTDEVRERERTRPIERRSVVVKDAPPPYDTLLQYCHQWIARLYGVQITCRVKDGYGNWSKSEIDGRRATNDDPDEVQRLLHALRIIAGKEPCLDDLMSNVDVALAALAQYEQERKP